MRIYDETSYVMSPHQLETSLIALNKAGEKQLHDRLSLDLQLSTLLGNAGVIVTEEAAQAIVSTIGDTIDRPEVPAYRQAVGRGILRSYFYSDQL